VAGIMGYGWYQFSLTLKEKKYLILFNDRQLDAEKAWMRISLVPLLQAEMDRDTVRRLDASVKREEEIMKNVQGWKAGDLKAPIKGIGDDPEAFEPVYYTEKYIRPSLVVLPKESIIPAQVWRGSNLLYMVFLFFLIFRILHIMKETISGNILQLDHHQQIKKNKSLFYIYMSSGCPGGRNSS
jgi:hypothetical protein